MAPSMVCIGGELPTSRWLAVCRTPLPGTATLVYVYETWRAKTVTRHVWRCGCLQHNAC